MSSSSVKRGGYSRVYINLAKNTVVKTTPYLGGEDRKTLMFNPFVDAILSKAFTVANAPGIPHVSKIYVANEMIYMEMPYLGKSLFEYSSKKLKPLALPVTTALARVCEILFWDLGVQHTDIKPGNVLISKGGFVHLIDFNMCSTKTSHEKHIWSDNVGTWEYASPEICIQNVPSHTSMVWSLGVLLACMYSGHHPLAIMMQEENVDPNEHGDWVRLLKRAQERNPIGLPFDVRTVKNIPLEIRKIIHECTYWDPRQRISIDQLEERLVRIHNTRKQIDFVDVDVKSQTFVMNPRGNPNRMMDLALMHMWCKRTNHMHILCRSIGIYDRISCAPSSRDAAVCLAISYMLIGNYIDENDGCIDYLMDLFGIYELSSFFKDVIRLCTRFQWNIYEIPADVLIRDDVTVSQNMNHQLFEIQRDMVQGYTMNDLLVQYKNTYAAK